MSIELLSLGKDTIPYEIITRSDSLNIVSDNEFFAVERFSFRPKSDLNSEEEYEVVKKLFLALKMEHFGELNKLYKFQDTIILCETFETRATYLNKIFKFN